VLASQEGLCPMELVLYNISEECAASIFRVDRVFMTFVVTAVSIQTIVM
jgi:hypothetical protein